MSRIGRALKKSLSSVLEALGDNSKKIVKNLADTVLTKSDAGLKRLTKALDPDQTISFLSSMGKQSDSVKSKIGRVIADDAVLKNKVLNSLGELDASDANKILGDLNLSSLKKFDDNLDDFADAGTDAFRKSGDDLAEAAGDGFRKSGDDLAESATDSFRKSGDDFAESAGDAGKKTSGFKKFKDKLKNTSSAAAQKCAKNPLKCAAAVGAAWYLTVDAINKSEQYKTCMSFCVPTNWDDVQNGTTDDVQYSKLDDFEDPSVVDEEQPFCEATHLSPKYKLRENVPHCLNYCNDTCGELHESVIGKITGQVGDFIEDPMAYIKEKALYVVGALVALIVVLALVRKVFGAIGL